MSCLLLLSASLVTAAHGACSGTLPTAMPLESKAEPVRIAYRDWLSAQLAAQILRHTLEMGGHQVELVDMRGRATAKIWNCDLSHGSCADDERHFMIDVDPESWQLNRMTNPEKYALMVGGSNPTIFDAGSVGYDGQSGIFYAPGTLGTQHPGLMLNVPEAHSQDPRVQYMFSRARFADVGVQSEIHWTDYPAWNHWGRVDKNKSTWVPRHCDMSAHMCGELYHQNPDWDMGLIESLVLTYRLPYAVQYLGDATRRIRQHFRGMNLPKKCTPVFNGTSIKTVCVDATEPEPVLFYHWSPDALPMVISAEKMVFPTYTPGCVEKEGSIGKRKCGPVVVRLAKAASSRLRWEVPSAYMIVARFALSLSELTSMLKFHHEGGGTFKNVEDVACHFVQSNSDLLAGWAKGCDPDYQLDVKDLKCWKTGDDSLVLCSRDNEVCGACQMCLQCVIPALFITVLTVTMA